MDLPSPTVKGILLKRYKRFLADVELGNGEIVTAHCANTGSMLTVCETNTEVWLSIPGTPSRKLKYSWELYTPPNTKHLVGINTANANKIVYEAISNNKIPELDGYDEIRKEVKYGNNSRIDILLQSPGKKDCYIEVKNVTMSRQKGLEEFPDAVTKRGSKHLFELSETVRQGNRAVMLFLVQRNDINSFSIAKDIDNEYYNNIIAAIEAGVEIYCYDCNLSPEKLTLRNQFLLCY